MTFIKTFILSFLACFSINCWAAEFIVPPCLKLKMPEGFLSTQEYFRGQSETWLTTIPGVSGYFRLPAFRPRAENKEVISQVVAVAIKSIDAVQGKALETAHRSLFSALLKLGASPEEMSLIREALKTREISLSEWPVSLILPVEQIVRFEFELKQAPDLSGMTPKEFAKSYDDFIEGKQTWTSERYPENFGNGDKAPDVYDFNMDYLEVLATLTHQGLIDKKRFNAAWSKTIDVYIERFFKTGSAQEKGQSIGILIGDHTPHSRLLNLKKANLGFRKLIYSANLIDYELVEIVVHGLKKLKKVGFDLNPSSGGIKLLVEPETVLSRIESAEEKKKILELLKAGL